MKRKRISYEDWLSATDKTLTVRRIREAFFDGYVGLVKINAVEKPQTWRFHGRDIVFCDSGLQWLSMLPEDGAYCIGALLNAKSEPVLWYIDMIADWGVDPDGVPWFDDLYLDLVVDPSGSMIVDDQNELEAALRQGDITQAQFGLALRTCEKLQSGFRQNISNLQALTKTCLTFMNLEGNV